MVSPADTEKLEKMDKFKAWLNNKLDHSEVTEAKTRLQKLHPLRLEPIQNVFESLQCFKASPIKKFKQIVPMNTKKR
jgi:hypothetical protein